jgi:exopolysaccharide production protein ExoZ
MYLFILGGIRKSFSNLIGSMLLLPGYAWMIIPPGWTLSYEVYFYLCFSIFMRFGKTRGIRLMTVFFSASIATGLIFHPESEGLRLLTNTLLAEFLFGAWIAYWLLGHVRVSAALSTFFCFIALVMFTIGILLGYNRWPSVLMWGVPSGVLIAGCVFLEYEGKLPNLVVRCSVLGDSSYSLYLIHVLAVSVLLEEYVRLGFTDNLGYVVLSVIITALSVLIAIVLYELIERRILKLLQSQIGRFQVR